MKLLWLICFVGPLLANAQQFPVDATTGKIEYAEEVLVKDGPQADLYIRAKAWFTNGGKNKLLLVDDAVNGILIGEKTSQFLINTGDKNEVFTLWCTVKLQLMDDRFWYNISDFHLQKLPVTKQIEPVKNPATKRPLEAWLYAKKKVNSKQDKLVPPPTLAAAVQQKIATLIDDLKAKML